MTPRLLVRVAVSWVGVAACLFAAAPAAYAHDELVGSDPANGAIVSVLPRAITLHFEEPPVTGYTQVRVADPSGTLVNSAGPITNGSDVSISIDHASLRGLYTVSFHILSDDGHAVSGAIHFTVGSATHRSSSTATGASKSTSLAGVVDVSLAAVAFALVSAMVSRRRRRTLSFGPGDTL
jgi:methionine-rich copper-binding protein CopC